MKAIGILGGMGPESTAYTYMQLIRYCQERYGARLDSDFPPVLIYSMPVPDVVEEGSDDSEILRLLDEGIGKLSSAGASFSLIACNTMQGFVPALSRKYAMLSLIEETAAEAVKTGINSWGLLGTEVTLRKGYYQDAFRERGLESLVLTRERQNAVTLAIREILAGGDMASPKKRLLEAVDALEAQGAEGIVLACTDLPLALPPGDTGLRILDTAVIAAKAAVERWRREGR